jgi:tetratricopeptide (TPR) repeat protein
VILALNLAFPGLVARAQVVTLTAGSYGDLSKRLHDLGPVADLAPSRSLAGVMSILEKGGGLKGLDRTKPVTATLDFLPNPQEGPPFVPQLVLYVPVTKQSELLGSLKELGLQVSRASRVSGFTYIIRPTEGMAPPFFVLESPPTGYTVVTNAPANAAKLRRIEPASSKPAQPSTLFASIRIDRLPDEVKQQWLAGSKRRNESSRQRLEGESDARYQGRLRGTDVAERIIVHFVPESRELSLKLDTDPKTGKLLLKVDLEPAPGTAMHDAFTAFSKKSSRFPGLTASGGMSFGGVVPLPEEIRALMRDGLEAERESSKKKLDAAGAKLSVAFLDFLGSNLLVPLFDGYVSLEAAASSGNNDAKTTVVVAAALENSKKAETAFRDAIAKDFSPRDRARTALDHARGSDGTSIHKFADMEMPLPNRQKTKGALFMAFPPGSVLMAYGPNALTAVQSALTKLRRPADGRGPQVSSSVSFTSLAQMGLISRPDFLDTMRKVFSGPNVKKDHLDVSLKAEGQRLKFSVEADPQLLSLVPARNSGWSHYERGLGLIDRGAYEKAISELELALQSNAREPEFTNRLAWVLATCPKATLRDGKRAISLATRACEATEWMNAYKIDTLAASYAEMGTFDEAVKWQKKAVELLPDARYRADYEARLSLYTRRMPYREGPPPR